MAWSSGEARQTEGRLFDPGPGSDLRRLCCPRIRRRELPVAIAFMQEFEVQAGDTSTTNYDAVSAELNLQQAPDGLLIHTAGFDHDSGVFRIFDVWESREHADKFMTEMLNPIIERMMAEATERQTRASSRRFERPGTSCTIR
jgi:hypothetical protein